MAKVSIVIPVYNVERYLRPCVDSVLSQTLRDIEVLLVDDGSTDGSPAICDRYAAEDVRVRVIHKANGGLSDARNAGLDAASGDLVGFVDSDDWVDPRMFELLARAIQDEGADIAVCNFTYARNDPSRCEPADSVPHDELLTRRQAMRLLLHDQLIQSYVWNKLYRRELWDGVRFPMGRAFEDILTTWQVFDRAEHVWATPWAGYFYRMRQDSIVHEPKVASQADCALANLDRLETLGDEFPECLPRMTLAVVISSVGLWRLAWGQRRDIGPELRREMRRLARFNARHRNDPEIGELAQKLGTVGKLELRLTRRAGALSYLCVHLLEKAYTRRHPEGVEVRLGL